MYDFLHCDPKRCTGALLTRRGLMLPVRLTTPFTGDRPVPFGSKTLSPADSDIIHKKGICVADCSWARL